VTVLRVKELDSSIYLIGFANIQLGLGFSIINQLNLKLTGLVMQEVTTSDKGLHKTDKIVPKNNVYAIMCLIAKGFVLSLIGIAAVLIMSTVFSIDPSHNNTNYGGNYNNFYFKTKKNKQSSCVLEVCVTESL